MARRREFDRHFHPTALDHLDAIELKYHGLIEKSVAEQLAFEPDLQTRNRKQLQRPSPFDAGWELRCGPQNRFRIFYTVNVDEGSVEILGIGIKDRSRLFFGGQEYQP